MKRQISTINVIGNEGRTNLASFSYVIYVVRFLKAWELEIWSKTNGSEEVQY